ncbi:MAG: hypothetical protein HZC23_00240 [Rhodocyclales bacterium]|nr:hypothetical protein [Rhodocyclales bacterium]
MAFEESLNDPARPLRCTRFSQRAEHLLNVAGLAMARRWPLLVALVYLDCLGGILLGRGAYGLGQILWHLCAIALTLLLATLGCLYGGLLSLHARPRQAGSEFVRCAAALALLIGILASSCTVTLAHPTPLHWLVRGLASASCLVLALAAVARLGRLGDCLRNQDLSASPTGR